MNEFPLRLIGDNIAIQYEESIPMSSLLVVPEGAQKRELCWAKVLAVGNGRRSKAGDRIPIGVSVGDRVLAAQQHMALKQAWILAENLFGRTDIVIIEEADIFVVDDG